MKKKERQACGLTTPEIGGRWRRDGCRGGGQFDLSFMGSSDVRSRLGECSKCGRRMINPVATASYLWCEGDTCPKFVPDVEGRD